MFKSSIKKLVLALGLVLTLSQAALADTIVKLDFVGNEAVSDFTFDGTTFAATNDGIGATTGLQDTALTFSGAFDPVADILAGASFSLGGVNVGAAVLSGVLINAGTTGGSFAMYDAANTLLLSATLGTGNISGPVGGVAGSFFNVSLATVNGGSLAGLILPGVSLSIALNNVSPSFGVTNCLNGTVCSLNAFTADGVGVIDGQPVPEPITAALLLPGLLIARRMRKNA